jgi:tripartite ATP-independent transporter DctP family solute receptor
MLTMKLKTVFLLIYLTFCVISCGENTSDTGSAGSSKDKIVITVAHDAKGNHPYVPASEKFKEVLEAETDGEVEVSLFPFGQLGSEDQLIQAVNLGTLDAVAISAGNMSPHVPELDLFNLPFIFRDVDHFYKVLDGPVGRWVARTIEKNLNVVFIDFWTVGTRHAWNGERPIRVPDDLQGLKIRVMGSPILIESFNIFGAQATSMSWGELYSALQLGVIDGAESSLVDILVERFYEVSKYVSLTGHTIGAASFIFNKNRYEQLPPHIQTAILKAGREATLEARSADARFGDKAIQQLEELGMEFFEVDRESFKQLVRPIYEKYAQQTGGMKLIDQVINQ